MSFCCLTNIYWSNSKMTSISYNYNTKYTTKWKHSLAWYDVAINNKMKTCILLFSFKAKSRKYQWVFELKSRVKTWQVRGIWSQQLTCVYQIGWPNGLGTRLENQGSWVRVPVWARIFHPGFRSLQPELVHANEINRDILRANTRFWKKGSLEKIWLPFPVVENFSCQL